MHGLIHVVFKHFVADEFGHHVWSESLQQLGILDDAPLLKPRQHSDELTLQIVGTVVERLQVPLDMALQAFGKYFFRYMAGQGWMTMLASMGNNLKEFLGSLNELHHFLERDLRTAVFPFFTVEDGPEGGLRLTYKSKRKLPALMVGILTELGAVMFKERLSIVEVVRSEDHIVWQVDALGSVEPGTPAEGRRAATGEPAVVKPGCHRMRISFWQFHQAMISCCRAKNVAENGPKLPVVETNDEAVIRSECADFEVPSPMFFTSSCTPSSDGGVNLCDQIRAAFCLQPNMPLVRWVRGSEQSVRLEVARELMRAVPAATVGSSWDLVSDFEAGSDGFWETSKMNPKFLRWSTRCHGGRLEGNGGIGDVPLHFVSHSWDAPEDWDSLIGSGCSYSKFKAATVCWVAKDIAAKMLHSAADWGDVHFWLDKCCIPQNDKEALELHIQLLEEFMQLCDGLVVIFTWAYLSRLWCVYEWACFLVFHDPADLIISAETAYRASTEDLFLNAIRKFSVDNCECNDPEDRALLSEKILEYYGSNEAFERFLRFSAIALVSRAVAGRCVRGGAAGFHSWAALADECGFAQLAAAIRSADPAVWRQDSLIRKEGKSSLDLQAEFQERCDRWFAVEISPLIILERETATRAHVKSSMSVKKSNITRSKSARSNTSTHFQALHTTTSPSMMTRHSMQSNKSTL